MRQEASDADLLSTLRAELREARARADLMACKLDKGMESKWSPVRKECLLDLNDILQEGCCQEIPHYRYPGSGLYIYIYI